MYVTDPQIILTHMGTNLVVMRFLIPSVATHSLTPSAMASKGADIASQSIFLCLSLFLFPAVGPHLVFITIFNATVRMSPAKATTAVSGRQHVLPFRMATMTIAFVSVCNNKIIVGVYRVD